MICDKGMSHLSEGIHDNCTLKELGLCNSQLNIYIYIYLENNYIGDEGIKCLKDALKKQRTALKLISLGIYIYIYILIYYLL